jgi:hypothetical protein
MIEAIRDYNIDMHRTSIIQSNLIVIKKSNVPSIHANQKQLHIRYIIFLKYTCKLVQKITSHGLQIPTCATPKRHHSYMLG